CLAAIHLSLFFSLLFRRPPRSTLFPYTTLFRFFTEVRYEGKPFATMVAGMPESSKSSGAFDGMQGSFYSSPNADETILQAEFAKELDPQTASLIGKDLILRYAERQSLAAQPGEESSGGFSVVPKDMHLRIIGVVETEPASGFGGF